MALTLQNPRQGARMVEHTVGMAIKRQGWFLWAAAIALFALLGISSVAPRVEYSYFPVVRDFRLVSQQQLPDGSILFQVNYEKIRNCAPRDLVWYRTRGGDDFEPALITRDGGPRSLPNYPLGPVLSGVWKAAEPGQFMAVVKYDCGLPWTTLAKYGPVALVGQD